MTYMFRKFVRELWGMKFRGIVIILSIGLSVGIYGGLLLVKENAFASRDDIFEKTNYEDGRIVLYNSVDLNSIKTVLTNVEHIKQLDFRLSVDVTVFFNGHSYPSLLHNILETNESNINGFVMKAGDVNTISKHKLIVEKRFTDANNLEVGDKISIKYGNFSYSTDIGGIAFAPEHMYSMNPITSLPERGVFAPIWFSLDYLTSVLHLPLIINEILFKVDNLNNLDTTINDLLQTLQQNGIQGYGIRFDKELDFTMMKEDVGTLDKFAVAIGVIILLVAIFVIFDSIMKIIATQTQMIGILRALGATTSTLMIHYVSYGMVLTGLGVLIGLPIGYGITLSSTSIFVEAIGFKVTTSVFRFSAFAPSILLALNVALLGSVLSTIKVIHIEPAEAITNQTIKKFSRKYIVEGLFDRISINKYSTKIPVRNVFRRRRRSLLTAITIAMSALLILTSFGFLDSFFHQMDGFYEKNSVADMEMSFTDPIPISVLADQMNKVTGVQTYEGMVRQAAYVYGTSANESTVIYAYQRDTVMRHYTFKEGSLIAGQIAIGQILARKLDVNVGDTITLLTRGKTIFDIIERDYRISGITEEFFDNFVFMDLKTLQADFQYGEMINTVAIKVGGTSDNVVSQLYNTDLPIANIINLEQSKDSFKSLMEAVIGFAYFVIGLGVLVLILFSLNVIVMDIMERQREFINIRISGGTVGVITKIIGLQILLISILVLVLDFFLTPVFSSFLIDQTMKNMAYVGFYMKLVSYVMSFLSILVGIFVGLFTAITNVIRMNIVETMRLRFKN